MWTSQPEGRIRRACRRIQSAAINPLRDFHAAGFSFLGAAFFIAGRDARDAPHLSIRRSLKISERVAIGLAVEAELKAQGERRGGDTSSGEQRNPVNSPECSGKETREIAAQKAGFGSEFTYRQAKAVVQNAIRWNSRRRASAGAGLKQQVRILVAIATNIQGNALTLSRLKKPALKVAALTARPDWLCSRARRLKSFTPSERVAIGLAVEAELGNRRGQRTDLASGELPVNSPEVNSPECSGKETREIAAEKAGFGSEFTYRQAKAVVQNASPELIEAMDSGAVACAKFCTS